MPKASHDLTRMMMRFGVAFLVGAGLMTILFVSRYILMEKTVRVEAEIVAKCANPGEYKGSPLHCNKYRYTYDDQGYIVWGTATAREDTDKPVGTILSIEILPSDPGKVVEMPDSVLIITVVVGGVMLFTSVILLMVAGPSFRKRTLKTTGALSTGYVTKVKHYYGKSPSGAILVRAKAPDGSVHIYKSEYIYLMQVGQFEPTMKSSKPVPVDVYVDLRNPRRGYVDVLSGPSQKPIDKNLDAIKEDL